MAAPRETILEALLALATGAIASSFTGIAAGAVVSGIGSTAGVFAGLPASAPGWPDGTLVQSVDGPSQVTLTQSGPAGPATFATGLRTVGRRVLPRSELADQPALFLVDPVEDYGKRRAAGLPAVVTMMPEIWLYSDAGADSDVAPAIMLNNLLDAVEAQLQPPVPGQRQTLGGLVYDTRIQGRQSKFPGDLGSQARAVLRLALIVPSLGASGGLPPVPVPPEPPQPPPLVSPMIVFLDARSGPLAYELPPGPPFLFRVEAKDRYGMAETNRISIVTGDGSLIDDTEEFVFDQNFQEASFVWNGTGWSVF
jgi:hypothetical protein